MEQAATVVLQSADRALEIRVCSSDIAKDPNIRRVAGQVVGSRGAAHAPVVRPAATRGVDADFGTIRSDVVDNLPQAWR